MNILNSTIINTKIITQKSYTYPFIPVSFISLTEQSFEIFPKHTGYAVLQKLLFGIDMFL